MEQAPLCRHLSSISIAMVKFGTKNSSVRNGVFEACFV